MIITKSEDLQKVRDFIADNTILAYDLETTGLAPRTDKVVGVGLHNGTDGFYLLHLGYDGEKLVEFLTRDEIASVLCLLGNKKLVGHNLSFDMRFTYNYFSLDLISAIYSDSMLAKHTVEEDPITFGTFGLKDIASRLYGADATVEQQAMKASIKANGGKANEMYKADPYLLGEYCLKDCQLSLDINNHYLQKIASEGLTAFYFEQEVIPLYKLVTIPMELAGVPIDLEAIYKTQAEIEIDLAALEKTILDQIMPLLTPFEYDFYNKNYPVRTSGPFAQTLALLTGAEVEKTATGAPSLAAKQIARLAAEHPVRAFIEGRGLPHELQLQVQKKMHGDGPLFNLRSKQNLGYLFFSILREKPTSFTEHGTPQVDNEFLDTVKGNYPFVPLLRAFNKLTKIKGTYIEQLLEKQEAGIYYPTFQLHRTISGRLSSDTQQLPRKIEPGSELDVVVKYNNRIRDFFKAQDSQTFVGADYESLEPKIFAHVSGDQNLKNIFIKGLDFYSEVAVRTEGFAASSDKSASNYLGKINKAARQTAKAYALGIAYGMSAYKLKFEIDVSQDRAEQLVSDYLRAFPDLKIWIDRTHDLVNSTGKVASEAGRIRHMPTAAQIFEEHGDIRNSLDLWKRFHEQETKYKEMKKLRRQYVNLLNNGCNFQIQSLAASIVNRACISMAQAFKEARLQARIVLQVHDEVVVITEKDEAQQVADIMQTIMEQTYKISVPLVAKPQIGQVYGELK